MLWDEIGDGQCVCVLDVEVEDLKVRARQDFFDIEIFLVVVQRL